MTSIHPLTLLLRWLEHKEAQYNPELRLLRSAFSSPGYHTAIKEAPFVHRTRESLTYAVALLDSEIAEYQERGCAIIEQVISLQDTDRERDTFGIWSWFYEEPLDKMAPPDWNWADFCGKQLLLAVLRYPQLFTGELGERVQQALFNACDAIIKRNVGPGYTNIAIMGSFVTILTGEYYGRQDYIDYGLKRFEAFYHHTMRIGTFEEYNSPTYTTVAIVELSSLNTELNNVQAKEWCSELLHVAWRMVAEHFHPSTGQWSGPQCRSYDTFLRAEYKSFIQVGTQEAVIFFEQNELYYEPGWYKNEIRCPQEYIALFTEKDERWSKQLYYEEKTNLFRKWATTYQNERFSLGTVNKENMWNQRRNLLAYLNREGEPTAVTLRVLHDGYDYAAAMFTGAQYREHVLFGINFGTDGGDTHNSIDRIKGSIEAEDLRIRLEFAGNLHGIQTELESNEGHVTVGENVVSIKPIYAQFDGHEPRGVIGQADGNMVVDYIIYSGNRKKIDFEALTQAVLVFGFRIATEAGIPQTEWTAEAGKLSARLYTAEHTLELSLEMKPQTMHSLFQKNESNGME